MPASLIAVIVLRMYCLSWLVQGLVLLAGNINTIVSLIGAKESNMLELLSALLPIVLLLFMAVVGWIIAPALSRRIVGKNDAIVVISGLSRGDLYCFAFIFLGLYFTLDSLASVMNWFHYFFMNEATTRGIYQQSSPPSYYGLSQPLITLVAGLLCIFKGKRWAGKLIEAGK